MAAELRKDLIVNRWVIISPRRGKRPHDYQSSSSFKPSEKSGPCAFCYHHEHETGQELLAFPAGSDGDGPCWRVRVVQNKYPAVTTDVEQSGALCPADVGVFEGCCLPAFGSHEVVIETPDHDTNFAELPVSQVQEILRAYQCRIESLRSDARFKFCQVFKNKGNAAGASMSHSHSQIIALPIVTRAVEEEISGCKAYYEDHGSCVLCDGFQQDVTSGRIRLIDETPYAISICPFAPRFPYETWILPRAHNSNFGVVSPDEIKGVAEILQRTLRKIDKLFDHPPYNFMLHTAPLQDVDAPYYHWHIRIVPHLVTLAGFELGSGCYINPVSPESSAEFLRNVQLLD